MLFNSPSGAACFVGGASLNGKGAWKDRQGRNLNQIEEAEVRKAVQERRLTGSSGLRVGLGECGWAGAGGVGVGRWMVGGWLGSGRVDTLGGRRTLSHLTALTGQRVLPGISTFLGLGRRRPVGSYVRRRGRRT
ncbi:DUF4357 domain-containing protein [Actinomyces procaprae]|uniref:DUF4357 domain-containing protein n=1 Tax=Actinomyces procaprae TaxID=2560010 RepID=UPI003CD0E251